MDPSSVFKRDVNTLLTVSPSIFSYQPTQSRYVDVFYEDTHSHSLAIDQRRNGSGNSHPIREKQTRIQGIGIHAFSQNDRVYNYVDGAPSLSNLEQCAKSMGLSTYPRTSVPNISPPDSYKELSYPPDHISSTEKQQLIRDVLEAVYSYGPDLISASVEYQDRIRRKCAVDCLGHVSICHEATLGLHLHLSQRVDSTIVRAASTHLAPNRFGILSLDELLPLIISTVHQAASKPLTKPISSGTLPVIFEGAPTSLLPESKSNASIWLHEAIGHALEADQYKQHAPVALGGQLTTRPLSISDASGLFSTTRESSSDDEGIHTKPINLVVQGHLQRVLTDKYHAALLDVQNTGHGRRQNYRHAPLPRMNTLYLHPGTARNEDLVSSVKEGIYVKSISHGQTHTHNQQVLLEIQEGYYIKDGHLTHPLSNVTIEGKGIEMLNHIEGIGDDLPSTPQMVQCIKEQQIVPVSVASPTVLIGCMNVYQHS